MHDIRRMMRAVAGDLWRVPQPEAKHEAGEPAVPADPAEPAALSFESIWKAVDDEIDWTALLAAPARHPQLAALAPDVLAGDPVAYRRALDIIRPLTDLAPFMQECAVGITDADALSVCYSAAFDASDRCAACGLALRAARDLLAALPIFTVRVEAVHQDGMILRAAYTRDDLRRVRMTVADPEQLTAACGAWSKE